MYKVLIRPLEINDAKVSWKWRNNPKIWELTGSKPSKEITYDIEKEWIKKVLNDERSKRFAILVDDKYIGNVQLTNIKERDSAEYHIFIGDVNYWNKGIAKLASLQLIRFAKEVLGLKKIFLFVKPEHTAAIKLYKSCNFIIVSDEIKMELDLENITLPMVSVFVMVYNHEKFITDAVDSFLMQKCNFDFEIVIGEDCSNDNSRKILLDYQNKFPGKFKLLLHKNNIGAHNNQKEVFKNCTGKYIAMCEGDDYWTDPYKLQKQVDFLEHNPKYVACGHYREIINDNTKIIKKDKLKQIKTQCAVFRSEPINNKIFLKYLHKVYNADTFLFSYLDQLGKIKILKFYGACYRISNTGVYSLKTHDFKVKVGLETLKFKMQMFDELGIDTNVVHQNIKNFYFFAALGFLKIHDFDNSNFYYKQFLTYKMPKTIVTYELSCFFKRIRFFIRKNMAL